MFISQKSLSRHTPDKVVKFTMKFITSILLLLFLVSCGPANYSEVRQMGYTYTALAEPENQIGQNLGAFGASNYSQREASDGAMRICRGYYSNCVMTYEGSRYVYVSQAEKNKKILNESLANAVSKAKNECKDLGFVDGSKEYADCNLKLSSLYKEEALEQQKIMLAEQQAELAKRQANAAKAQAQAAQRQAAESQRRNSNALMQQGMKMLSGGCTLGIDC
tara:strand:- start:89 stop:751 length:663 start_codon:yes stop_codon:yes gene_type:complete